MKILMIVVMCISGCVSKPVCINGNDGFNSVMDPSRNCSVRIRQVVLGSDIALPQSISFKNSETQWTYHWVESRYKDGMLELGHFALYPTGNEIPSDAK